MLASYKIYVKVSTKVKLGDRGGCSGDKSGVSLDRVSEGGGGGVRGVGSQCCLNISLLLSCFHLFT